MSRLSTGIALATALSAATTSGALAQENAEQESFEQPHHVHVSVCDKSKQAALKIGIDLTFSLTDIKRLGITPDRFGSIFAPFGSRLTTAWHNAWVDAAAEHISLQDRGSIAAHFGNSNSLASNQVQEALQPLLQEMENKTGITFKVASKLEGVAATIGAASCDIRKKQIGLEL
jgi:hypothetical protein